MGDEYGSLRKKFEELEEEVKKLKEPLETTLMDVRELISNLENPFNYATSMLSIGESKKPAEDATEKPVTQGSEYEDRDRGKSEPVFQSRYVKEFRKSDSLATIICAYLLLKILGRENAMGFLNSRAARKFSSPQLLESLIDAVEIILNLDSVRGFPIAKGKKLDEEFMVVAAYLLNMLSSGADEKFFTLLILILKILDSSSRND